MMKKTGSSKSISSPGRTDNKFPPPLMRFLRSNVSSKSRRTKSPMLIMRNKNSNTKLAIETTQEEPTSPKVTCIGQVRVARRSSSNTGSRRRSISVRKQQQQRTTTCCCCCSLSIKLHYLMSSLRLALKKQVCCCFQCGEKVEAINKVQNQHIRVSTSSTTTATGSIENSIVGADVSGDNMNPPKDALMLTRCRSAPYRSSSLASRFWGSPLNNHTSNSPESQSSPNYIQELEEEEENVVVKSPLPVLENPILPKSDESEEMKSSINEGSSKDKEKNGGGGGTYDVHPLLLTRCKSEPARTGERLNPRRFSELDSQS